MSTTLNIDELEQVIHRLLAHVKTEAGGPTVEIDQDYYWDVPLRYLYDVKLAPDALGREITIGSLVDDWNSLKPLSNDGTQPVALLLLKVAPLLSYLGGAVQEGQPPRHKKS